MYAFITLFVLALVLLVGTAAGIPLWLVCVLGLFLLWWFTWRPDMMEWWHDWRYMRAQKKILDEINVLEDLFKEN